MNGFIRSFLSRRFSKFPCAELFSNKGFSSKNIWKHQSWTILVQFICQTSVNQTHEAFTLCSGLCREIEFTYHAQHHEFKMRIYLAFILPSRVHALWSETEYKKRIDYHRSEASSSRTTVNFTQDVEMKKEWKLIKVEPKKCFGFYAERGLSISSIQSIIITQQSHIQWTYTMIQVMDVFSVWIGI